VNKYDPSDEAVAVWDAPEAGVIFTFAPGMIAPDSSKTWPWRDADCA
jgi:hypothetical protein